MVYTFESLFAERIRKFVEHKNALGFPYVDSTRNLRNFDRMCLSDFPQETVLTQEVALAWAIRKSSESNNGFRNRLMPVREFARYLNSRGEAAFVLPSNFVKRGHAQPPHIYSEEEILKLWEYFDNLPVHKNYPIRHRLIPVFMRVLYCCGLRPCEARKIRTCDVDLAKGRINIIESKGYKNRIVMMADDVAEICREYNDFASERMPGRVLFFPNSEGNQYTKKWIEKTFDIARRKTGLATSGEHPPRLYDFRHTFATHRLYQWYRNGKDLDVMLPYLSAYMGHVELSHTYYYIHLVPGLFEQMAGFDYSASEQLLPEVECND